MLHASDIDLSLQDVETNVNTENPKQMTQKQMNDLLGEDPYLGQTSYLQSPEGFNQYENLK